MKQKVRMFFLLTASMNAAQNESVMDSLWIWVALFALALVGLVILFLSSRQKIAIQKEYQQKLEKQLDMEYKQNQILTNMSENIYSVAQKVLMQSHNVIENSDKSSHEKKEMRGKVEDALLTVTNDLIYFLKLKSKKIEINHQSFNLNNVFNEVLGTVCSKYAGKEVELIFDINNDVPRHIIGDSLHFGQILTNIFEYLLVPLKDGELKLEATVPHVLGEDMRLQLKFIDSKKEWDKEELASLFIPFFDEKSGTYIGLSMYIAKALTQLMGGELEVQSTSGKGLACILTLPFKLVDVDNKRKYRLPKKAMTEKKVFISDTNYNAALAIKKMFAYFRHEVTVMHQEEFELSVPKLETFDIVIINASFFTEKLHAYLEKIKTEKPLKIIVLSSLMNAKATQFHDGLVDAHLFKPLHQERIFELIIDLYEIHILQLPFGEDASNIDNKLPKAKVYTSDIREAKGISQESFSKFSGKHLLIVEDNMIIQKILLNMLVHSGMKIMIVKNGQEAVEAINISKAHFDFILMEINIPVMDGYTTAQVIRQNKKFDAVPIVAFTALVLESEKQKMFNSGMNAFLAKPLNVGKLYTIFEMYLSDKAVQSAIEERKKAQNAVFEGLDIYKGIANVNQNEALYTEMLKEFVAAYGKSDEVFRGLIREERYTQIKILCIDIRAVARTIGASKIQYMVNEIYQHIFYKKYGLIPGYMDKYAKELEKLNCAIEKYLLSWQLDD